MAKSVANGQTLFVTDTILPRTLWHQDGLERRSVPSSFLRSERRSIVVLGEAGMGKSTLLEEAAREGEGFVLCTARTLINASDATRRFSSATTLVIDALDEVPAQQDGDAVDRVAAKLAALDYPRFILSCRVADWRSATAMQGLADLYGEAPVELYLDPLDRLDAEQFLAQTLGPERAADAVTDLEDQGLGGLWSNPQTLDLVRRVLEHGSLPRSRGHLFEQATKLLRREHRATKQASRLSAKSEVDVLDAAGAAFAVLVLTGAEAISLQVDPETTDLALAEVADLPRAGALADVLDSRLFSAPQGDRFTYAHRAIGEFLGARWLARTADTARKRRRLLSLFNTETMTPVSLRGLHAWLAWHSPELASDVIGHDPMGVVQYGDADNLAVPQGRQLLDALDALARANPRFREWNRYRVGGLIQRPLLPRLEDVLGNPDTNFGLRFMILQGLQGSPLVRDLAAALLSLMRDPVAAPALRNEAAERLVEAGAEVDWRAEVAALLAQGGDGAVHLAIEILAAKGYEQFEDSLIRDVVLAQVRLDDRTVGILHHLEHNLPLERLDPLLDALAEAAHETEDTVTRSRPSNTNDLAYGLLARRVGQAPATAEQYWRWLKALDPHYGVNREASAEVSRRFETDPELRRPVQRLVLLDHQTEGNIRAASWRMVERSSGLTVTQEDALQLLAALPAGDPRWRDIVSLVPHDQDEGRALRRAAASFARGDAEARTWLETLAVPVIPQWQLDQERRGKAREADQRRRWAKHRAEFNRQIDRVAAGEFGLILSPAKAYLKLFADMGDDGLDGPGRLDEWLGPDLRDAALRGFEAFLKVEPAKPTATDISESHAVSRRWEAAFVIVAALAERIRTGRGFDDLPSERLMAGLFEIRSSRIDDHAGFPELDEVLAGLLRQRGLWEEVQRLYFEPQLAHGREHVDGLYAFMRDQSDDVLAGRLALEWLDRFDTVSPVAEVELVDHLVSSPDQIYALRDLVRNRLAQSDMDAARRLVWSSAGLLVDFDHTRARFEATGKVEDDLLWNIRSRLGGRRTDRVTLRLQPPQLKWMIETFRRRFPLESRPSGVTTGDTHGWDASEFVVSLIYRLGQDVGDPAIAAMAELRDAPWDRYTETLKGIAAEQQRKRIEADWKAPDFRSVAAALRDEIPTTARQLQAVVIEELVRVQAELRGSHLNWYKDFYVNGAPRGEEECRDALLKVLRPYPFGLQALPEGRLADGTRCDILCLLSDLLVPIEIKGQWHRDLWTAADRQLDFYVHDSRAEVGIYLVLWFGDVSGKRLVSPPKGVDRPTTPEELTVALERGSDKVQQGRIKVIVLDLERPA